MDQDLQLWEQRYDLLLTLSCKQREREEKEQARRLAIYDKREAEVAAAEYGLSLRSLRDRLRGTFRESQETMDRKAKHAAAVQEQVIRELEALDVEIQCLRQQLDTLALESFSWETESPERRQAMASIQGRYLAKCLPDLLDQCREGLTLAREYSRPQNVMDPQKLRQMQYDSTGKAGFAATKIRELLQELNACLSWLEQEPVEIEGYFENPHGYLVTAAKYGNLDRINLALGQVAKCERVTENLLGMFEE